MRIRWTVPAAEDLEGIKNYLEQHYPHFAEPTVRTIYHRIRSLKTAPNRGRPGHRSGTRELLPTPLPYRVYSVKAEAVEILHIHHGAKIGDSLRALWPGSAAKPHAVYLGSCYAHLSPKPRPLFHKG
jgi:plasmid stabilization system protein ParE